MAARSKVSTEIVSHEEHNLFLQGWNRMYDVLRGRTMYYNKEFGDRLLTLDEAIAVQEAANALKD